MADIPKPKVVGHDESPSVVTDHAFQPKDAWYSLCAHGTCNLAESAHRDSVLHPFEETQAFEKTQGKKGG